MVSSALLRLHLSILIAGFTGILGKLIELDSFVLSGYRSIFTAAMFFCFLLITKNLIKIPAKKLRKNYCFRHTFRHSLDLLLRID